MEGFANNFMGTFLQACKSGEEVEFGNRIEER